MKAKIRSLHVKLRLDISMQPLRIQVFFIVLAKVGPVCFWYDFSDILPIKAHE